MEASAKRKRRFNPSENETPAVERLYREKQPSFARAGGFIAEETEEVERRRNAAAEKKKRLDALPRPDIDNCEKCGQLLLEAWLWEHFALPVCDDCKDIEHDHKLLSRTQAKEEFMLKDEDLDMRKPILRYISKKNPHNPRYGDMKLYVRCQLEERMILVHGSHEEMEEKREARNSAKEKRAGKAFDKKVKEMRQHMLGAAARKAKDVDIHVHEFGEEVNVGEDEWEKECSTCGHKVTYEKM